MVLYYSSVSQYLQSGSTLDAKIALCQKIIDNMSALILDYSTSGVAGQSEYSLDNGQTKVKGSYRSIDDLSRSIVAIEAQMWRYINQKNGRMTRLSDQANFRRRGGGC